MSLELAIRLAPPRGVLVAGEEVTGHVEARSSTGTDVRGLTLEVGWRTEGEGNRATGTSQEVTLLDRIMNIGRGESRRFPFHIRAPQGPISYTGKHLRVTNFLRVRADVPWARDPSAELAFDLQPANGQAVAFQGPDLDTVAAPVGPARLRARPNPADVLGGAVIAIAAVSVAALSVASGLPAPAQLGIALAALVIAAAAAVFPFRARIAERRLGTVELVLDRTTAAPGDTIRVAITFEPQTDMRMRRATARLVGTERVVKGAGKHRRTRRHVVGMVEANLAGATPVRAGGRMALWAPLRLPPDAPCSFRAGDNQLEWRVEVRVAVRAWPDWVRVQPVLVLPVTPRVPAA